jgi:hypothetical protein
MCLNNQAECQIQKCFAKVNARIVFDGFELFNCIEGKKSVRKKMDIGDLILLFLVYFTKFKLNNFKKRVTMVV